MPKPGNAVSVELRVLTTDRANDLVPEGPAVPQSGCLILLHTLLADVFVCREGKSKVFREQRRQDVRWLQSAESRPFSFLWCCEQAGLDPGAVRRAYFGGQGLPDCRFTRANRYPLRAN